jgi:drug/metabolite transporter (DMT)-like permease
MACAIVGVAVMVAGSDGMGTLEGDLLAMVIPCFFALAVVIVRRNPAVSMAPAVTLAAILQAVVAQFFAAPFAVGTGDFVLLAVFGSCQLGFGLALFVTGARFLPAAETALLAMAENILGPLWVWIFIGENPGLHAVIGGIIVLAALVVHSVLDMRPTARPVPPLP